MLKRTSNPKVAGSSPAGCVPLKQRLLSSYAWQSFSFGRKNSHFKAEFVNSSSIWSLVGIESSVPTSYRLSVPTNSVGGSSRCSSDRQNLERLEAEGLLTS